MSAAYLAPPPFSQRSHPFPQSLFYSGPQGLLNHLSNPNHSSKINIPISSYHWVASSAHVLYCMQPTEFSVMMEILSTYTGQNGSHDPHVPI